MVIGLHGAGHVSYEGLGFVVVCAEGAAQAGRYFPPLHVW